MLHCHIQNEDLHEARLCKDTNITSLLYLGSTNLTELWHGAALIRRTRHIASGDLVTTKKKAELFVIIMDEQTEEGKGGIS